MNAEVDRRRFVASIAAGIPALAGAGYAASPAWPLDHAHDQAPGAGVDAVLDHVVREVAAIHHRGRSHGFTGEHARAVASQLRTAVVRGAQLGIDAPAKAALTNLIRVRGRHAVLSLEIDTRHTKDLLSRYGIDADERSFPSRALDDRTRNKALDAVAAGGITGVLTHAADLFEKMAVTLDRIGPAARVPVQFDYNWFSFCWPMLVEIQLLQAQAAAICAAGSMFGGIEVACAGMQASISVMYAMYYAFCA